MAELSPQENNIQENDFAYQQIIHLLNSKNINYKLTTHKPTKTSQESAEVRGATIASGAKAMLIKESKNQIFCLLVMSAAKKLSWKLAKQIINSKKCGMASEIDVYEITKCLPGAVPPFGSIFKIQTYMDNSLIQQGDIINFNCGLRTKSIQMQIQDYLKVENSQICDFTEE
ncbi:YbaK/aminoacyl-tRNA synthetase-associated domain [Pseudocohnilembus persalinus]|uniref:YbaK/aminoacyl-tRNA synthetase-associated domain n=1 Tax=Pseudocohnilembus persalinus TaxID=266149 RepID=A0A0V0R8N2_PSEPJ|nr:YbaK/aminoacyl-tRNA synthetase-associated domain [Pseudocohnilembus persalinus]|eukprot:KRX10736.1 YbaK/aminoacyl-tRNA synthetase-associated domain [Pseudocohnilembus persalinus]